jgi:hypothetical protein
VTFAAAPVFPVRRFTVEEYHRLADLGILTEDDRVELLNGVISPKMVHKPPHDAAIELADESIRSRLPAGWRIRIQSAITTADSEPEPDLVVVRGAARNHATRHPTTDDIGLVIEVADSSLSRDREKASIYAAAGIQRYGIVNLVDACVEIFSLPSGTAPVPGYAQSAKYVAGEEIPFVLDAKDLGSIPAADLLV